MSKEHKYVLVAALVLFSIAAFIVASTKKKSAIDLEQRAFFDDVPQVDSVPVQPSVIEDAYIAIKAEEQKVPIESGQPVREANPADEAKPVSTPPAPKVKREKYQKEEEEISSEPLSPAADRFAVQTAVLSTLEAAKAAESRLRSKGFHRALYVRTGSKFTIYAGTYPDQSSALALKRKLDRMRIDSFIKEIE
ncbi:MAG: SPOR domain-containing protein [Saprospiraceae bacterium]